MILRSCDKIVPNTKLSTMKKCLGKFVLCMFIVANEILIQPIKK